MNEIVRFLRLEGGQAEVLSLWEAVLALVITACCAMVIAMVYRKTHSGLGYSPSYAQTLVLTSVVTALIMVVIGSNIARAFSLVGALSIIRFRNAIKETRDVGYIFFSMAIAMASGTRFYALALVATGLISVLMILLHAFQFGATEAEPDRLLRVRLSADVEPLQILEAPFQDLFTSYSLIMLETVKQGMFAEAVFSVRRKPEVTASQVLRRISEVNDNLKVSYDIGLHSEEV